MLMLLMLLMVLVGLLVLALGWGVASGILFCAVGPGVLVDGQVIYVQSAIGICKIVVARSGIGVGIGVWRCPWTRHAER